MKEMVALLSNRRQLLPWLSCLKVMLVLAAVCPYLGPKCAISASLRFNRNGELKILQVADMHYADGKSTGCLDVLPSQVKGCSDLNTTAFLQRMIKAKKPDLIVFTENLLGHV